jgi:hypothetical protein
MRSKWFDEYEAGRRHSLERKNWIKEMLSDGLSGLGSKAYQRGYARGFDVRWRRRASLQPSAFERFVGGAILVLIICFVTFIVGLFKH